MTKRNYILDIPGNTEHKSTEIGQFVSKLSTFVRFKPGISFGFNDGLRNIIKFPSAEHVLGETWLDTETGLERLDNRWWIELVSQHSLQNIEQLLNEYNLNYLKDTKCYNLCCDQTTQESKSLLVHNYQDEKLLFISSPVQLFSPKAVAYLPKYTTEDERLELSLIELMINERNDKQNHGPHTTYRLFDTEKQAKDYVQDEIETRLKGCKTSWDQKTEYDVVIYEDIESKERVRYPTGVEIVDGMSVIHVSGCLPKCVKTYSHGKALTQDQEEYLPLAQYFNKKEGIKIFDNIGACERCYETLGDNLKIKADVELRINEYNGLVGTTATQIGYIFDPNRIKVRIINKNPLRSYKK